MFERGSTLADFLVVDSPATIQSSLRMDKYSGSPLTSVGVFAPVMELDHGPIRGLCH